MTRIHQENFSAKYISEPEKHSFEKLGGTAASEDEEEEEKKKHHAEFKLILKTCLVYLLFFEGPSVIKKMAEQNNS